MQEVIIMLVYSTVYCREYIRMIVSMTYQVVWRCCVCRSHCTDNKHRMGESETGSCACVLESEY
jgi:hypothetical protein